LIYKHLNAANIPKTLASLKLPKIRVILPVEKAELGLNEHGLYSPKLSITCDLYLVINQIRVHLIL